MLDSEVVNSPSDRIERPVGNGIFVYSTAPVGPAVRLVAQPGIVRAVAGAGVALRVAAVDAANHAAAERPRFRNRRAARRSARSATDVFYARASRRRAHRAARRHAEGNGARSRCWRPRRRLSIEPPDANVDNGGTLQLSAHAADAHGYPLALADNACVEHATGGSIDGRRPLSRRHRTTHASACASATCRRTRCDGRIARSSVCRLPNARAFRRFRAAAAAASRAIRNAAAASRSRTRLRGNERAAYAMADLPLPRDTIGVSFDVLDDGSASRLRIALRNAINEDVLPDAALLDQPGLAPRRRALSAGSLRRHACSRFTSFRRSGMQLSSGQIDLRNVRAVVAGN